MITRVTKLRATKRSDASRDEIARSLETEASKRASIEMRRKANLAELEKRRGQKSLPSRSQLEKEARERARVAFAQLAHQSIERALAWADELEEQSQQRARRDEQEAPQPALSGSLTRRGKGVGGGLSPLRAETPEQVVAARTHWMQKQRRRKLDKDKATTGGDDLKALFSVLSCDMSEPRRDHASDGTQGMGSFKGPGTSSDEEDEEYKEQLNNTMTQLSDELFRTRTRLDRVRIKRTYFDSSFSFTLRPELTSSESAQMPPLKSEHLTLMAEEAQLHKKIRHLQTQLTNIFFAIEHSPRQQDLLEMLEALKTQPSGGEESEAGEVVEEEGLQDSQNFPVDVGKAEKAEGEVVVQEVGAAGEEVEWVMIPEEIERRSSVPEIEHSNPLPHVPVGAPQSGEELEEREMSEKQIRHREGGGRNGREDGKGVERRDGGEEKRGVAGQGEGEGEGQGEGGGRRLGLAQMPLSTPGARSSRLEILKRQHDKGWVFAEAARRGGGGGGGEGGGV